MTFVHGVLISPVCHEVSMPFLHLKHPQLGDYFLTVLLQSSTRYTAVYIELLRRKFTFRSKNPFRSTLDDRTPHTSSYLCLRTGRSGGNDFTYRQCSYVNTSFKNVSKPKIPKSTHFQLHRQLHCYSADIIYTFRNILFTSS